MNMPRACLPFYLAASLLSGCAVNSNTRALSDIYVGHRTAIVGDYTADKIKSAIDSADTDPVKRNKVLNDLILIVDMNYYSVEKNLYGKKAWFDFGSSTAVIGLTGIATLQSAENVKNILTTIAGGIEGTQAAFNRDILAEQSILAIINTMRRLRIERLGILRQGMTDLTGTAYPLRLALTDLAAYYNAGTFTVALQEIVAKTGQSKEVAEKKLAEDIRKNFQTASQNTPLLPGLGAPLTPAAADTTAIDTD